MIKNRQNNLNKQIQGVPSANCLRRQEQLWNLIKEPIGDTNFSINLIKKIKNNKNVCDLRDKKGRHIVQFAMIHKPLFVDTILSVNEKTLALGSTPDKHGRLPSVYWIADRFAQKSIYETNETSLVIPKQINEEAWYQAAELVYELDFSLARSGLCSNKVQRKFEKTTGKKLDEWIEKEAANGNPWFERMFNLIVKKTKNKKYNNIEDYFRFSNVMKIWADPDNPRVVNEAHALFRAHLMFARFTDTCNIDILNNLHKYKNRIDARNAQKFENFLKIHLSGKTFDNFKNQINNGISFIDYYVYEKLIQTRWWKEACATIEKENLLKKHVEIVNTTTHNKFAAL